MRQALPALERARAALGPVANVVAKATLATLDLSHETILRSRAGERAAARTVRVRFTAEQRRRISAGQGNRCMYCGVRLNRNNLQLDHIYPVEFGGPNEESNLQALCGRCNARKGVQTDADFRERYREVLGNVPVGQPPATRIPYERFDAITRRTRQGDTTRALRRLMFRTPRQKIASGSVVMGAVTGGAWLITMALVLEGWSVCRLFWRRGYRRGDMVRLDPAGQANRRVVQGRVAPYGRIRQKHAC